MKQHWTDEQIMAYLDGQMDSDAEYSAVEAALHGDAGLRERLQALVDSGERIRLAYQHKLLEPVPVRLIESIWQAPVGTARQRQPAPRPEARGEHSSLGQRVRALLFPGHALWGGVVAASVAWLALGLTLAPNMPGQSPAQAQWAQAGAVLENDRVLLALQALPSGQVVQVRGTTLEVMASFAGADGQVCRELQETRQVSGGTQTDLALACSTGDGQWNVAAAASSLNASGAYQTASDAMHQTMDAALRQLGMGPELTPEQESALMAHGWR